MRESGPLRESGGAGERESGSPTSPLGRRWFRAFPLPTPFFPFGEGFPPPPYPLPWTWTGPVATHWSVQDGPRWLQEGLREPKMASKIAQDSPTWLKIAHHMPPRGSNTASKRLQEAKEPPKEAPERPKSFK